MVSSNLHYSKFIEKIIAVKHFVQPSLTRKINVTHVQGILIRSVMEQSKNFEWE
jgi:hypothetical protein